MWLHHQGFYVIQFDQTGVLCSSSEAAALPKQKQEFGPEPQIKQTT
jgi:hypothetical protein